MRPGTHARRAKRLVRDLIGTRAGCKTYKAALYDEINALVVLADAPKSVACAEGYQVTITRSAGADRAVVIFVDGPEEGPTRVEMPDGSPRCRILLNDEPVYAPVDFDEGDEEAKARATCSTCLARTYRGEECVCEDGGDAEDFDASSIEADPMSAQREGA